MGDRCYMEVTCRQSDAETFEEMGFREEGGGINLGELAGTLCTIADQQANYAHHGDMPAKIPYFGYHDAGGDYGPMVFACDGAGAFAEAPTHHDAGGPLVGLLQDGSVDRESLQSTREYLKIKRRAMLALGFADGHPDMPPAFPAPEAALRQAAEETDRSPPDAIQALRGLFEHCAMIHARWGDHDNTREAQAAIEQARAVLARVDGAEEEDDNARRVRLGRQAAQAGMGGSDWGPDDEPHTQLVDALTNLRHYAESAGIDFDSADRMAREHWREERTEAPAVPLGSEPRAQ